MDNIRKIETIGGARIVRPRNSDTIWTVFYILSDGTEIKGKSWSKNENMMDFGSVVSAMSMRTTDIIGDIIAGRIETYDEKTDTVKIMNLTAGKRSASGLISFWKYVDGVQKYPTW